MQINPSLLSGGIALALGAGIVAILGLVSLLSGTFFFLFVRPGFKFLKSENDNGFAFAFEGNPSNDGTIKFDNLTIRLFNPFGNPTQKEISKDFPPSDGSFAREIPLDMSLNDLTNAKGFNKATISFKISSKRSGISHYFEMKGSQMKKRLKNAKHTLKEYNERSSSSSSKPLYTQTSREFIAGPMGDIPEKVLKIPTNPMFVPDFLGTSKEAADNTPAAENFNIKKVWIEPGCIVCDACEGIYPEVFEVLDDTCIIRENAPLDNGLLVEEAAEACPVEVIKFTKA